MSEPEKLTRHWRNDPRKRVRRRGFEVQEARAADAHGGKLTAGSGSSSRASQKGDSVSDYFRASSKTTEKRGAKSIRVERAWLREVEAQARATGHRPLFNFGFSPDDAHPERDDWIGFPLPLAKHLILAAVNLVQGNEEEARAYAALALGESR
jgi:hypothetical protein